LLFAAATIALLGTPFSSYAAPSALASYDFDADTGTTLADRSGNNHPGTLINGPTWTAGKYNGGLSFDGVNDYVSFGDIAQADSLAAITVSVWVKFAATGGGASETHFLDKSLCNGYPNGGPWELGAALTSAHKAEFVIYPQGANPAAYVFSGPSTTSIDDGAWHYVTGRYDGSRLSIWVDGNLENSSSIGAVTMLNSNSSVELGGHCDGLAQMFKGTLDDVRLYDRALTPSEILADMSTPVGNGGSTPADTTPPTTPTNLTASGVTASQVTLSWQASTDNVGISGYRVYRDGTLVGSPSSTNFTSTGLASNTSYAFTVAAFDSAGNTSSQSAPRAVTTATSGSGGSGVYATNFVATENPLSEAGKWVVGKAIGLDWNNPQSASGKVYASVLSGANGASRYNDSIAHLNASSQPFTANQYAQGTVYLANGYSGASHEVELLLRFSINAHDAHGYEVLWGLTGYLAVVRWNGPLGNYTPVYDPGAGSMPVPRDGDVLRAEVSGNTLKVILNGVTKATVNLSSAGAVWSSGQPGIGFWPVDNATPQNYGWKSFEAGNL